MDAARRQEWHPYRAPWPHAGDDAMDAKDLPGGRMVKAVSRPAARPGDFVVSSGLLATAWTTDWPTAEAGARLAEFGIAPPGASSVATARVIDARALHRRVARAAVPCPRCGSARTCELSRFGSTPCKAQYRCEDCLEPFDYFKPQ